MIIINLFNISNRKRMEKILKEMIKEYLQKNPENKYEWSSNTVRVSGRVRSLISSQEER